MPQVFAQQAGMEPDGSIAAQGTQDAADCRPYPRGNNAVADDFEDRRVTEQARDSFPDGGYLGEPELGGEVIPDKPPGGNHNRGQGQDPQGDNHHQG